MLTMQKGVISMKTRRSLNKRTLASFGEDGRPGQRGRSGKGKAGKDREMWAGSDSVWNSEVEAVPIVQLGDSEVSINDSMSPIILALSAEIYLLCSQNNQPSESGRGNEGSLNNASDSEGMGETNHIDSEAVTVAATEIKIPEESGRSKRRRVPHKHADALNGCLCGQVLDSSLNGVLECKQAGCETQWVSTKYYEHG